MSSPVSLLRRRRRRRGRRHYSFSPAAGRLSKAFLALQRFLAFVLNVFSGHENYRQCGKRGDDSGQPHYISTLRNQEDAA